jgi:DNA repair ATPase RecN
VSSESVSSPKRLTRAEQEVQSASERLNEQVDEALAAVAALRDPDGVGELEARADRLERAARDLSVALRELAEERRVHERE